MDVRASFEEFLNNRIQQEFEQFLKSASSPENKVYRNGYRMRRLNTTLGSIELRIPRALGAKESFIPSFIDRWKRNTNELNELIKRMYTNGISTRKVNRCTSAVGVSVSKSQVSTINKKYSNETINKSDLSKHKYKALYFDATFEKVRINNKVQLCAMISVISYLKRGYKTIAIMPAPDLESESSYSRIIKNLLNRGLKEPELIISDYHLGLLTAMKKLLPNTKHQRCKVHFIRNVMAKLDKKGKHVLGKQLKQIYHTSSKTEATQRAQAIISKYKKKYPKACKVLNDGINSTLSYTEFSNNRLKHRRIESSNPIENINRQYKNRTKTIASFPNIEACIRIYNAIANDLNHKI